MSNGKELDPVREDVQLNNLTERSCRETTPEEGEERQVISDAASEMHSPTHTPTSGQSEMISDGGVVPHLDTDEILNRQDDAKLHNEPSTSQAEAAVPEAVPQSVTQELSDAEPDEQKVREADGVFGLGEEESASPPADPSVDREVQEESVGAEFPHEPMTEQVTVEITSQVLTQETNEAQLNAQTEQATQDGADSVEAEESERSSVSQSELPEAQETPAAVEYSPGSPIEQHGEKVLSPPVAREYVRRSIESDAEQMQQEQAKVAQTFAELGLWVNRQRDLATTVLCLQERFRDVRTEYNLQEQALPPEALKALANRKQSIELCERMLERLANRITAESTPDVPEHADLLPPLGEDEVSTLLLEDSTGLPEERLKQMLKNRRIRNHKTITELRDLTETAQKKFLTTVERQLLPILDGLDEGKRICAAIRDELRERFPDHRTALDAWFSVYDALISTTLSQLVALNIRPISVRRGDPVDYELHEPFDVEEDSELANEHVKEVVRRGFVVLNADENSTRILRPGQVIVVKNPREE
jgi:molecular chaperone GrpE (heat shock protein)